MSEMKEFEQDKMDLTAIYGWAAVLVFGSLATILLMAGVYERGKAESIERLQVSTQYREVTDIEAKQTANLAKIKIEAAKAATIKELKKN